MKNLILSSLIFLSCHCISSGQPLKTEFSMNMNNIHVLVLNLSGHTTIRESADNETSMQSSLTSGGSVVGLKFPSKRPAFNVISTISSDTLYLFSPPVYSPSSIGINTYSENIDNQILIPSGKILVIRGKDELVIEKYHGRVNICNSGHTVLKLEKNSIKDLSCESVKGMILATNKHSDTYTMNGIGTDEYTVSSETISLTLK
jgi:hypothetical protein